MIIDVNDFGIEWQKSDKVVHKADFDDLINAYEKLKKIEQIFDKTYYNICNACSDSVLSDCKCCEFNMIEQIVKD